MPKDNDVPQALTSGAQRLVEGAARKQQEGKHAQLGVHHWLLALVERHGAMAEEMAQGLEAASLQHYLREQMRRGNVGDTLDQESLVRQAVARAQARGKSQASERDLAAVILTAAGYALTEQPPAVSHQPPAASSRPSPLDPQPTSRSPRPTPTLNRFGRDLTHAAQEGKLSPFVGREEEMQLVIETLCRRTKRNPCLVGPAGVGKTAIAEGLAQRIVRGEVPDALRGARVLAVQPSTLVAGASVWGELEKRMKALLAEASQEGIILFIDEVHSMIGAGGHEGTGDVASLLKPALARGDLACIAATTDDEYRRFIEPDAALERRFQPIRVQELTAEQTLKVLSTLRDELARLRNVQVSDAILRWLVEFAQQFLRNRYFPDKAVDLLEQCVAYAIAQGKTVVEQEDAATVARRMVGMPLALGERLSALRQQLSERALMTEEDRDTLLNRLAVTLRGLDVRPARPNAVVLLIGEAAASSEVLAGVIAASLFGAAERVVTIDFSRFTHPEDVTMLVGAPPGYVGYRDALPIHRVVQMPWCVLRGENLHACHPQVREVLQQALAEGFLTDGRGKRIYLSDAVVLLTAEIEPASQRPLGFRQAETVSAESARQAAAKVLGEEFVAHCDLVCVHGGGLSCAALLSDLSERYRKQGVHLRWDEGFIQWLLTQQSTLANQRDWERFVDEQFSPLLIPHLPPTSDQEVRLLIRVGEGLIHVEREKEERRD
ncbi:MAG: AAA family ATPase [Abditibacteriales bacterium]|nr:AAA family ATPase [Abditibacteriales bacterium]